MPPLDPLKTVEFFRRLMVAIAEGRIEAKHYVDFTEEQIDALNEQLADEWESEGADGKEMAGE
jgi:hypothetical protein